MVASFDTHLFWEVLHSSPYWKGALLAIGLTCASLGAACLIAFPLALLWLIGWAAVYEMHTSHLEAWLFTRINHSMTVSAQSGPNDSIRFPKSGPYDERLGYSALPQFISALTSHHYAVEQQARWSKGMDRFVDLGGFPIYAEKDRAGLRIFLRALRKLPLCAPMGPSARMLHAPSKPHRTERLRE